MGYPSGRKRALVLGGIATAIVVASAAAGVALGRLSGGGDEAVVATDDTTTTTFDLGVPLDGGTTTTAFTIPDGIVTSAPTLVAPTLPPPISPIAPVGPVTSSGSATTARRGTTTTRRSTTTRAGGSTSTTVAASDPAARRVQSTEYAVEVNAVDDGEEVVGNLRRLDGRTAPVQAIWTVTSAASCLTSRVTDNRSTGGEDPHRYAFGVVSGNVATVSVVLADGPPIVAPQANAPTGTRNLRVWAVEVPPNVAVTRVTSTTKDDQPGPATTGEPSAMSPSCVAPPSP